LWLDGSEFLGQENFEHYWAADLFVLTVSNAPPDAQHLERVLSGKTASI
jgi:hypothetical protein